MCLLTFGRWCYYTFTVTVSRYYVITREWWFRVHFIHAENFSLSTKSNLMHIAPWSEDDLRQLSNCDQWFLFLKETKWLNALENHNQPLFESHGVSNPFPRSRHAVSHIGFSSARVLPPGFLPWGQSILWGGHSSFNRTMLQCLATFSVWIIWTGNCKDVLRSAETFQSLAPFSNFILGFFCFLTGYSPSLRNWIMGSLDVTDCWFAL